MSGGAAPDAADTMTPAPAVPEIVVLGFPRCGTSALMFSLEADPGIDTLHIAEGKFAVASQRLEKVKNPDHAVRKKKQTFFANCTVRQYDRPAARHRLRHDWHFGNLLETGPKERGMVVSQERMAQDMDSVRNFLKARARGEAVTPPLAAETAEGHRGFADRAGAVSVPKVIRDELRRVRNRLRGTIERSGVAACL